MQVPKTKSAATETAYREALDSPVCPVRNRGYTIGVSYFSSLFLFLGRAVY